MSICRYGVGMYKYLTVSILVSIQSKFKHLQHTPSHMVTSRHPINQINSTKLEHFFVTNALTLYDCPPQQFKYRATIGMETVCRLSLADLE